MIRLPLTLALLLAFVPANVFAADPSSGTGQAPIDVSVVIPTTGPVALVGQSSMNALTILADQVNKSGGINGRPVKFDFQDDQSNPSVTVQLVSRLIASKKAIVLGPNLSGSCSAISPLVKNGPVSMCFSPGIHPDEGSFVFSPAPSTNDIATVAARYFHKRGWKRVAFLFTTDGSGVDGEKVLNQIFGLPENKDLTFADVEHYGVADLSVAAQVARIKASQPDAVYVWVTGTPTTTALRAISDSGLTVPVFASYSNATNAQMAAMKAYLPKEFLIIGLPTMVPPEQLARGQLRAQVDAYYRAFKAVGQRTNVLDTTAWDAGLLIVDALRKLGPSATAEQVRAYLAGLSGFTGVTGRFDFKAIPQRGVDWKSSLLVARWDAAKDSFATVSPIGG